MDPSVQQEWREIKLEVALLKDSTATWTEMFQGRLRRRTLVGIGIMFFQQFSGINALLYYAYTLAARGFNLVRRCLSRLACRVRRRYCVPVA
jgi:Sugar (and other) transporter